MPLWILGAIGWLTIVLVTNVVIYLLSRDPLGKLIIDSSTLSVQQKLCRCFASSHWGNIFSLPLYLFTLVQAFIGSAHS